MQILPRRRYFVDRRLQIGAASVIGASCLTVVAFQACLTYFRLAPVVAVAEAPTSLSIQLLENTLVTLAFLCVVAGVVGIVASHRVAGPMVHLKASLRRVRAGRLDEDVQLRRNDELWPIAEGLNGALAGLRETAALDRAHVQEAIRLIALAKAGTDVAELQTTLDRAVQSLRAVGASLEFDGPPLVVPPPGSNGSAKPAAAAEVAPRS